MLKKILLGLAIIVVIIGILVWRVFANLDELVAGLIQDAGSSALKTEVTVSGVEIKLTEGTATIAGLRIANPEGWSDAPIFDLERISVGIDIGSISKPVIVLNHVEVGKSSVSYEMKADGSNNMSDLLASIESSAGGEPEADETAQATLLNIKSLTFDGMDVAVQAESPPDAEEPGVKNMAFSLPELEMQNVGGNSGATPQQIGVEVGKEMAGEIIEAAAREGVNRLIEQQKEKLKDRLLDRLKRD